MKIAVCIKQVPSTDSKIKLNAEASYIDTNGIKWVMNPFDEFAVEEAVKLKEQNPGAAVTVFSVGPKKRIVETLRTALAMGCDQAVAIDGPEVCDPSAISKILSLAMTTEGGPFDVIFTGKSSIDMNNMSTAQMLAEKLAIPHVTVISKLSKSDSTYTVTKDVEGGTKEVITVNSPVLFSANKGLNTPRLTSLPSIMNAKKKPMKELDAVTLGYLVTDQKLAFKNLSLPPEKPAAKLLAGEAKAQVADLFKLLRDEAKAL